LSNGDAREVIALGCPPAKIRVVPGFVDTKVFAPGYTEREDSLIWVGRFVPEKRLDLLIRAQEILTERRVNTQLTLVGDGPLFDSVRRLIHRSALEGRVALPGGVSRAAVATYLRRSSIFVFASTKEGMPLSVLEAMSAGKAIVAPNIPSMREIIQDGDNGLFFESGDANSMADRIQTMLLDVALRKRIGANARRTVLAKFSSEKVIEQIENLYNEAISAC
jgi:glycosyltransferase involved in cell wall biosynthesis